VLVGVVLPGFFGMMGGVHRMSVGDVGMVPALFVIAGFVVLRCFPVMSGRVFMMLRRRVMVFCSLVSHRGSPCVAIRLNNITSLLTLFENTVNNAFYFDEGLAGNQACRLRHFTQPRRERCRKKLKSQGRSVDSRLPYSSAEAEDNG